MLYFLFAHDKYYPQGGISDNYGIFHSLEAAKMASNHLMEDNVYVVIVEDNKFKVVWTRGKED